MSDRLSANDFDIKYRPTLYRPTYYVEFDVAKIVYILLDKYKIVAIFSFIVASRPKSKTA